MHSHVSEPLSASLHAPQGASPCGLGRCFTMEGDKVSYIRDVWHDNLESEMATIREMVVSYPCISMDTEFPGVVVKPIGSFKSGADYLYQTLRTNADLLKIIQVGFYEIRAIRFARTCRRCCFCCCTTAAAAAAPPTPLTAAALT